MAFYYVKNDGTATADAGRYATKQTGTFAGIGVSGYYASVALAMAATTTPVLGDFIFVSDVHSFSTSSSQNYNAPANVVCVNDAAIDAGRSSGRGNETITGTSGDFNISTVALISGLELQVGDNFVFTANSTVHDCKLILTGNGDEILIPTTDSSSIYMVNCELALNHAGARIRIQNAGTFFKQGGSVTTTSAGLTALFQDGFTAGGGTIDWSGVDISAVTGTILVGMGVNQSGDDVINIRFDMCKLASGVAFTNETFKSYDQRALFTRCSAVSAEAEHQYHLHAFGGDVDDDTTIRRAEDDAFEDSGTIISYKIVTNSDASVGQPLWFEFPNTRWMKLALESTDTLRFHIASTTALTDADIYVEISYPGGTTKQLAKFLSSAPATIGGTFDFLASGTTLTTDSGSDWRDGGSALTGHNEYVIDIDTSGNAGADSSPIVKIYVTKPSVTIQLGSIYEQIA